MNAQIVFLIMVGVLLFSLLIGSWVFVALGMTGIPDESEYVKYDRSCSLGLTQKSCFGSWPSFYFYGRDNTSQRHQFSDL